MWISNLRIKNIKSFVDSNLIELSKGINILVGENNSGKSIIIKVLNFLQYQNSLTSADIRKGVNPENCEAIITFDGLNENNLIRGITLEEFLPSGIYGSKVYISFNQNNKQFFLHARRNNMPQSTVIIERFWNVEPNNLIYPFLSKRNY